MAGTTTTVRSVRLKFQTKDLDDHTEFNAAWTTADDNYHRICPPCFENFRDRFEWTIEDPPTTPGTAK